MTVPTTDRRTLLRYWNAFLLIAGLLVSWLATDPDAREFLATLGGPVTFGIGLLNLLLNRVPAALKVLEDGEPKP